MQAIVERTGLDPARIDDVILGDANQAGEDNRNVGALRRAAGRVPLDPCPASTVNRLCGSSVEAVIQGVARDRDRRRRHHPRRRRRVDEPRAVRGREGAAAVPGGQPDDVEHVDRVAHGQPEAAQGLDDLERRVAPRSSPRSTASRARRRTSSPRASHRLAAEAWAAGIYDGEIVQVDGHELARDEGIRDDSTVETLAGLKPAVRRRRQGTVTAGNSSPINDGASAVLLGARGRAGCRAAGADHRRAACSATTPTCSASRRSRRRTGRWRAPAARGPTSTSSSSTRRSRRRSSRACGSGPSSTPTKLNIHGGAIAIGHPLGASGGRIIGHAAHELNRRGGGVAVAAICIGVGQGLAVVLER